MSEGDLSHDRGKTARAISRARTALRSTLDGSDPVSSVSRIGNSGEGSGGASEGKKTGIEQLGRSLDLVSSGDGGSKNPSNGLENHSERERSLERGIGLRNIRHGKIGSGTNPENSGLESGSTPEQHDSSGNPASTLEEEDQTLLNFPPEAYFKDGKLKKLWSDKLNGVKKSHHAKNEARPVALVKKKGISFSSDKDLADQVTEGIGFIFDALDLGSEYGLGVADVWALDENEAAVFTRILLKRADKGDKKALKTIATISENMDLLQAGTIIIPRIGVTIKEVATNGIRPKINRGGSKKSTIKSPGSNPAGV
jgi:hypothetical protein